MRMALVKGSSQQLSFWCGPENWSPHWCKYINWLLGKDKRKRMCSFDYVGMTESILFTWMAWMGEFHFWTFGRTQISSQICPVHIKTDAIFWKPAYAEKYAIPTRKASMQWFLIFCYLYFVKKKKKKKGALSVPALNCKRALPREWGAMEKMKRPNIRHFVANSGFDAVFQCNAWFKIKRWKDTPPLR